MLICYIIHTKSEAAEQNASKRSQERFKLNSLSVPTFHLFKEENKKAQLNYDLIAMSK